MKAIVIGIMPQDKIRERVLSIARGEHKPKSGEPKIWFTSMRSLAEVLSDENRALLQVIKEDESAVHHVLGRNDRTQAGQPLADAQDHVELRHR